MIEVTSLFDERLLRTLAQFSVTPQGQAVLAWLEACKLKQLDELSQLDEDIQVRRAQGAAQTFESIVEAITSAQHTIQKMDQRS